MVYLQSYIFIYHPPSCPSPPQLGDLPGARQGKTLFCSCIPWLSACASIHQPVHLCSLSFQMWLSALKSRRWCWLDFGCLGLLTLTTRDKTERRVLVCKPDQNLLPPNICFPLCEHFWLFTSQPAYALYQNLCDPIYKPVFCPIIWFDNYFDLVT